MIILDTNVISELMRTEPDDRVVQWVASHKPITLAITSITVAEIQRGITRLPQGKKRDKLEQHFAQFINEAFAGRIYGFGRDAALQYGVIAYQREQQGYHADPVDMMIAAVAHVHHATLATRNIKDFDECGLSLINPWEVKH